MNIRIIYRLTLLTLLFAGISACEQPEEPLTPPAAQQKAGNNQKSQANTQTAAVEDEFDDASPVYEFGDITAESNLPTTELAAEEIFEEDVSPSESADLTETAASAPEPVPLFPPEFLARASAHICFFSFNTGVEYVQLKRMVKQLNAASDVNITVTEYQLYDSDPYDNFVDLLKSGKQCDGVVLSGHHTDEFYGERSDGDLEIEDLEELACEPRFASWFANVKALWLQGCNTVKAGVTNEDVDEDELIAASPIQHMQRLIDPSDMEDTVEDMYDLLYENTNEENLVNDYMRVFSGATVYGWSNIAPGEQAGARKSIPFHIAQMSRLVDSDRKYFQNPLQSRIPPVAAERYSQVLYGALKRPNRPDEAFPEKLNEATFMQGWRDHGNVRYSYAFDNHDIEAFPALGNSRNEILKQVKGLSCLMHQLDDRLEDMSMLEVADYILRDRILTTYNSYLLWSMLRSLPKDSADYKSLHARLKTDDHLVKELRFASSLGGYTQNDARQFLASLGVSEKAVVASKPAVTKEAEATSVAAPAAEKSDPQAQQPAKTETSSDSKPSKVVATEKKRAAEKPEPWYMNEGQGGAAASDEPVFEFSGDSPG